MWDEGDNSTTSTTGSAPSTAEDWFYLNHEYEPEEIEFYAPKRLQNLPPVPMRLGSPGRVIVREPQRIGKQRPWTGRNFKGRVAT